MNKKVLGMLVLGSLVFIGCDSDTTGGIPSDGTTDTKGLSGPTSENGDYYTNSDLNKIENEYKLEANGYGWGSLDINCEGDRTDWVEAIDDKVRETIPQVSIFKDQIEIEVETETSGVQNFKIDRDDIYLKAGVIPIVYKYEKTLRAQIKLSPSLCEYDSGAVVTLVGDIKSHDNKSIGLELTEQSLPTQTNYYTYSGNSVYGDVEECADPLAVYLENSSGMYLKRASIIDGVLKLEASELFEDLTADVSIDLNANEGFNFYEYDERGSYLIYTFPECNGNNLMSLFLEKATEAEWEKEN